MRSLCSQSTSLGLEALAQRLPAAAVAAAAVAVAAARGATAEDFGSSAEAEDGEGVGEGEGEGEGESDGEAGAAAVAGAGAASAASSAAVKRSPTSQARSGYGGGAGGGAGGGGGSGGGGERYERLPPGVRHMLRFQRVVARAPQQVLRYCWDGAPLWPVPPPPGFAASVPRCGGCGAARRFEMQLMPHVLVGLDALEDGGAGDGSGAPAPAPALDFLTVLVFSCEASCDGAGGGLLEEEHVFVVPGGDDRLVRLR